MHQSQQRSRRPGKSQRRHQISPNQIRHCGAIPTTQLVQALQWRESPSRERVDWPETTIQKPLISSTSERLRDSNGPQDQGYREYQNFDSMAMSPVFQEPPSVWFCHIMAVESAVADMEKENEKHFEATALLLDELESKLTTLAIAIEEATALPSIWDEMTEWDQ